MFVDVSASFCIFLVITRAVTRVPINELGLLHGYPLTNYYPASKIMSYVYRVYISSTRPCYSRPTYSLINITLH